MLWVAAQVVVKKVYQVLQVVQAAVVAVMGVVVEQQPLDKEMLASLEQAEVVVVVVVQEQQDQVELVALA